MLKELNLEEQLKKLIQIFEDSTLSRLVYKEGEFSIKLVKSNLTEKKYCFDEKIENVYQEKKNQHSILSTEVGVISIVTPIKVGTQVFKGDILGKINVLDLEIPIVCSVNGILKQIFVENEDVVDFNRLLFEVEVVS